MSGMSELDTLRRKIDMTDDILIEGLLKRFEFVREVAEAKGKLGMKVEVPEREDEVRSRIEAAVSVHGGDAQAVEKMLGAILNIYDAIMAESKLFQKQILSPPEDGKEI